MLAWIFNLINPPDKRDAEIERHATAFHTQKEKFDNEINRSATDLKYAKEQYEVAVRDMVGSLMKDGK